MPEGRCYACCQENCGYTMCSCSCHGNSQSRSQKPEPKQPLAVFYAVRNEKGQYYRTYDKNRSSGWKNDLEDAKLWTRIGPAKGKVTALSNEKPNLPVPDVIEFRVTELHVVDLKAHVAAARISKQRERAEHEARVKQMLVEQAEYELKQAQAKLKKLRGE